MGKLKSLVVLGALGGLVAAVAKKLQAGRDEGSLWQSAPDSGAPGAPARPTPPLPPEPTEPPAPPAPAPDELLVDNAPEPIDEPEDAPQDAPESPAVGDRPDPLTDPLPEEPQS
ncbi:hypothetical protein FHP29_14520 [Nocardioides albidus]|uniref:Uncharacterized protein n=1 Tax=Nocardioides albidus TaxID=1517589 RepID=A0A5C4VRR8_9ACTN|nr:DLW-39 family protein [Nocardioides albidus]TNM38461.1 hypothetical protein FHP29_14520 [Nocardioides albidus]